MSQLMPIPEVTGVFTEAFLLDDHSETVFYFIHWQRYCYTSLSCQLVYSCQSGWFN